MKTCKEINAAFIPYEAQVILVLVYCVAFKLIKLITNWAHWADIHYRFQLTGSFAFKRFGLGGDLWCFMFLLTFFMGFRFV